MLPQSGISFLKKDNIIDLLEDVQKFGLRMCTKSWNKDYRELLAQSRLPTLQARCHQAKLCQLYKIINGGSFFPDAPTQTREFTYSSRTVHKSSLVPLHSRSLQFQNSFSPSSIEAWNSLSENVASSSSFSAFKYHLKNS